MMLVIVVSKVKRYVLQKGEAKVPLNLVNFQLFQCTRINKSSSPIFTHPVSFQVAIDVGGIARTVGRELIHKLVLVWPLLIHVDLCSIIGNASASVEIRRASHHFQLKGYHAVVEGCL